MNVNLETFVPNNVPENQTCWITKTLFKYKKCFAESCAGITNIVLNITIKAANRHAHRVHVINHVMIFILSITNGGADGLMFRPEMSDRVRGNVRHLRDSQANTWNNVLENVRPCALAF